MAVAGRALDPTAPPRRDASPTRSRRPWTTIAVVVVAGVALAWAAFAPATPPRATLLGRDADTLPGAPARAVVERWAVPQERPVLALAMAGTRVVVADQRDGGSDPVVRLRALDVATGRRAWSRELPAHTAGAVVADDQVVLAVAQWWTTPPGSVLGLSLVDGSTRWAHELDGILGLRPADTGLLVSGSDRCVLLEAATGRVQRATARDVAGATCPDVAAAQPLERLPGGARAHVRLDGSRLGVEATEDTVTVAGPHGETAQRRGLRDPVRHSGQLTTHGLLLPGPSGDWTSLGLYDYRDLSPRWTFDLGDARVLRLASSEAGVVVLSRAHLVEQDRASGRLRGFS